jgi:hypothetical protein
LYSTSFQHKYDNIPLLRQERLQVVDRIRWRPLGVQRTSRLYLVLIKHTLALNNVEGKIHACLRAHVVLRNGLLEQVLNDGLWSERDRKRLR